ncbi:MAG: hypothetical protein VX603_17925 [Gemmatimonadota bacterium]|nr:hypothetical protein [Gemmatimonadota bacterium]
MPCKIHPTYRDGEQHLVAEVYKAAGRRVELGLEPGTYTVQYQQDPG